MFTLIKKASVSKDTKAVSNQKFDAILGRIYTSRNLLSLERSDRISNFARFVKAFLPASRGARRYRGGPVRHRDTSSVSKKPKA